MKAQFLYVLMSLLFMAGCERVVEPLEKVSEVPANIIPTKPCVTLYSRIKALVPEYENNEATQFILFSDTVQKKIILTKDTELYLTFISEGASFNNTLGWYTYDIANPPLTARELNLHILFPRISDTILAAGDRLKLSDEKFKAGSVVGFFLIVNGWNYGSIDYSKVTFFSDYSLNPGQAQQHILFEEETCGDIVLAFEDIPSNKTTSDHDFNDVIFTITDNNSNLVNSSVDQNGMVIW